MRRVILFLGVFIFAISFPQSFYAQGLTDIKAEKSSTGGSNDPCLVCHYYAGTAVSIELKVIPNHFPFKVRDIELQNSSLPGMDINFMTSTDITYIKILKEIPNDLPEIYPNQPIQANSNLLDANGYLTIRFGYRAKFCLQSTYLGTSPEFRVRINVGIEKLMKLKSTRGSTGSSGSFAVIGYTRTAANFETGIGKNCDGSLPYYVNPDLTPPTGPSPGPHQQKTTLQENGFTFNLYPNPFEDKLLVNFETLENSSFRVKIFDSSGQLVMEDTGEKIYSSGSHTLKYNLHTLTRGIYMFQVLARGKIFTQKIIKQ